MQMTKEVKVQGCDATMTLRNPDAGIITTSIKIFIRVGGKQKSLDEPGFNKTPKTKPITLQPSILNY